MTSSLRLGSALLIGALALQACGGRMLHGSALPPTTASLGTVRSVSPASIPAPPMARTPILPSSVMTSAVRHTRAEIQSTGWTQLPGGASYVAASQDGSIWVLSSLDPGPDKSIWHYMGGVWTNVPGAAMRLAVAPNGVLWAVNSAGGIYAYNGTSWSTIAGGASDITVGSDGAVYVISNQAGGPYGRGIWKYANGGWTQLPGAALRVAASFDTQTYPGGIAPGGLYVTTAINEIYYYNPSTGFVRIPGAAGQVAPTTSGGLFALSYLTSPDGSHPIYYYNVAAGTWTPMPGAAVSIATAGTNVYAIGAAGGIYTAPIIGKPGAGPLTIASVDDASPTALTMLHVRTGGLDPTTPVTATFTNGPNYVAKLAPAAVAPDGTLSIPVPLYINPSTGQTATATLSLTLTQGSQTSAATSLAVQDIPQVSAYGASPGVISRSFFNYEILSLGEQVGAYDALANSRNNTVNTSQARNDAFTLLQNTITARNDIDRLMSGTSSIPVGTTSRGTNVQFNATSLALEDRVLGWYLLNVSAVANGLNRAHRVPSLAEIKRENRLRTLRVPLSTIGNIATILGSINATIDFNDALSKNDVISVITAVGGGMAGAVGAVALVTGAPAVAGTAAVVGIGFATVSIWNHVYHEWTDLSELERVDEQGGSGAQIQKIENDMNDERNGAVLDGIGALLGALGTAGGTDAKEVFGLLLNENATNAVEGAGLVKEAYSLIKSGLADQDRQTETSGVSEIVAALATGNPMFFQELTGTFTVSNSNGNSPLTALPGVQIDAYGSPITGGMADPSGQYDFMIPVLNPAIPYGSLSAVGYDPVTGSQLNTQTVDLSGLANGGSLTPITLQTMSGSCSDSDAGNPDADDPDCD